MTPEELAEEFDYLALRWSLRYVVAGVPTARIVEAGRAALANAAARYNPARGAFAPFARKEIRRKAARTAARLSDAFSQELP